MLQVRAQRSLEHMLHSGSEPDINHGLPPNDCRPICSSAPSPSESFYLALLQIRIRLFLGIPVWRRRVNRPRIKHKHMYTTHLKKKT